MRFSPHFLRSTLLLFLILGISQSARAQLTFSVAVSGVTQTQCPTNVNTTNVAAPIRSPFSTAVLLSELAVDENKAGLWSSKTFPAGAKLATDSGGFKVVDKDGNLLVGVSNIVTLTYPAGVPGWQGVGWQTLTKSSYSVANVQIGTLDYDTTGIGGVKTFSIVGQMTTRYAATATATRGVVLQTASIQMANGVGEGLNAAGTNIFFSGVTLTATSKQYVTNAPDR